MADETTPDAVSLVHELLYAASQQGPEETDQVADRLLSAIHAERARHAEGVAEFEGRISRLADCARNVADDRDSLREQLRKVEGERDDARQLAIQWRQRAVLAEQERDCLRSLLPDVRACAEYIVERGVDNADGSARRILAALDSQGGEGECLDRSDARGVAGDRCESGNECGRLGCPECQS